MVDPGDVELDTAAEVLAVLTVLLTPGVGRVKLRAAVEAFGSVAAAVASPDWSRVAGIGERSAGEVVRGLAATRRAGKAEAELDAAEALGAEAVLLADLPLALQRTPDPPPLLFVRGRFVVEDALSVGVVGSRACSAYGREQAARFAAHAADAGMTVVSGGARGIDAEAHRAVLRRVELGGRGRTVAVLGLGPGQALPGGARPNVRRDRRPRRRRVLGAADHDAAVEAELPGAEPDHQRALAGDPRGGGGGAEWGVDHGPRRVGRPRPDRDGGPRPCERPEQPPAATG